MIPDSINLREFASRYAAAWCSQNPLSVAGFFAPDGSLTINDAAPAIGRTAIAQSARGFMSAFPDMQVVMDKLVTRSGHIEFHWTLTGTNTGPAGTGHSVRISGFEQWHFAEDGSIANSFGHFDAQEYQHQLQHGFDGSKS
jgi:predicted ester cyclase